MTIGYSSFGQCFDNASDALDNYYTNQQATSYSVNGTLYLYRPVKISGSWFLDETTVKLSSTHLTMNNSLPTNVLGSCSILNDSTANFQNGMELGWGVAGVMAIAFCIRFLRRGR